MFFFWLQKGTLDQDGLWPGCADCRLGLIRALLGFHRASLLLQISFLYLFVCLVFNPRGNAEMKSQRRLEWRKERQKRII